MKKSYEVLKKAVDRTGIKKMASVLKVSPALVYKWCQNPAQIYSYKTASGAKNPLDRLVRIFETTQDPQIIQWLCQKADGYFVKNLPPEEAREKDVLKNIQNFIKEFSETLDTISECYANDGRISSKEAQEIRGQWEDLKKIGEGFVRACESGAYAKIKKKGKTTGGTNNVV